MFSSRQILIEIPSKQTKGWNRNVCTAVRHRLGQLSGTTLHWSKPKTLKACRLLRCDRKWLKPHKNSFYTWNRLFQWAMTKYMITMCGKSQLNTWESQQNGKCPLLSKFTPVLRQFHVLSRRSQLNLHLEKSISGCCCMNLRIKKHEASNIIDQCGNVTE